MYKLVLVTDNPDALLKRIIKGRYRLAKEVKVQDLDTQDVGVYDVDEFKTYPVRTFVLSAFLAFVGLLSIIGGVVLLGVWFMGLVSVLGHFGVEGVYLAGLGVLAFLSWPLARKLSRRYPQPAPRISRGVHASEMH